MSSGIKSSPAKNIGIEPRCSKGWIHRLFAYIVTDKDDYPPGDKGKTEWDRVENPAVTKTVIAKEMAPGPVVSESVKGRKFKQTKLLLNESSEQPRRITGVNKTNRGKKHSTGPKLAEKMDNLVVSLDIDRQIPYLTRKRRRR